MSYTLVVDPKAVEQAAEIHQYYKAIRQALADRFAHELDSCFKFIEENPLAYQVRLRAYRHALVNGFRYRVVYAIRGNNVVVYQVQHTRRRPSRTYGP